MQIEGHDTEKAHKILNLPDHSEKTERRKCCSRYENQCENKWKLETTEFGII